MGRPGRDAFDQGRASDVVDDDDDDYDNNDDDVNGDGDYALHLLPTLTSPLTVSASF